MQPVSPRISVKPATGALPNFSKPFKTGTKTCAEQGSVFGLEYKQIKAFHNDATFVVLMYLKKASIELKINEIKIIINQVIFALRMFPYFYYTSV